MNWLQRYRVRQFVRDSIWFAPVLGMVAALAAVRPLVSVDHALNLASPINPDAARAVLGTLAASMFTFIVFVSSSLLIVVQLASAQLTPRVIGIVFRSAVTRISLTFFVFTFTLTLAVLNRVADAVPMFTAQVTAYSCLASLVLFLYLIDHVGRTLRPSGTLRTVGRLGREVVEHVYPRAFVDDVGSQTNLTDPTTPDGRKETVVTSPTDGVLLAFDMSGLVALAKRTDSMIELVPQVGDDLAAGDPLFRVVGPPGAVTAAGLRRSVALGMERTVEQDPTFVFRILVDIANKGLSPAINDPTTAVLALDQIHHLLQMIGNRRLDEGEVRDAAGRLRLIYRTPDWEDFVQLAVTEIRQFGGQSIQIARRLRSMLERLIQVLPAERAELLRRELEVLRVSSHRLFAEPQDRDLADEADAQGVGGSHAAGRPTKSVRVSPSISPDKAASVGPGSSRVGFAD
jgi:uncharacterized membrane protein